MGVKLKSIVLASLGLAVVGASLFAGAPQAQVPGAGPLTRGPTQPPPTGPVPRVVTIIPTDQDRADLAAARQAPGAGRAASVMGRARQSPAAQAVAASPVPVLLPWTSPGMANVQVFVRGNTYAAALEEPGRAISIFGTKQAFVPPGAQPTPVPSAPNAAARAALNSVLAKASPGLRAQLGLPVSKAPTTPAAPKPPSNVRYQRTESGIDVSFTRFGAAYDLSLVCENPDTDPQCSQAAAKAVIDSLAVAGGGAGW